MVSDGGAQAWLGSAWRGWDSESPQEDRVLGGLLLQRSDVESAWNSRGRVREEVAREAILRGSSL